MIRGVEKGLQDLIKRIYGYEEFYYPYSWFDVDTIKPEIEPNAEEKERYQWLILPKG